ncbi:hypothetical protein GCM10008938_25400 [Deinococcus roseus]|uniref:Peptidyl-prolyl cis-trans isomerase n=2 Tax=Deinococcus roseus TaxID=392414 RepID=A0ABQ2D1B6_9DEIO|nr:hypothetical protein GCM10008938_25400 [Deinococcus roseus]
MVLTASLVACKPKDDTTDSSTSQTTETPETKPTETKPAETTPTVTAAEVLKGYTQEKALSEKPIRSFKEEPDRILKDNTDYVAKIETTQGDIVMDLFEEDTPASVNSFVFLALNHYYDGIKFHRVIDGFVVQGGDPNTLQEDRNTWGQGGPGYQFGLEVRSNLNFDEKGILGMARAQDPNSNGSQFYITLAPATSLNGQYTVFGKVLSGLDVLDKIKKYEAPAEGEPDSMKTVSIYTKSK